MKIYNKGLIFSLFILIMVCLPFVGFIAIKSGSPEDKLDGMLHTSESISWTTNGVVICNEISTQDNPQIVSDGAEGAIIVWRDYRNSNSDIYARKIDSSGMVQWTVNGTVICNASNDQINPQIISDGAGGAIITWQDSRGPDIQIYAQKISSTGTVQWDNNGTSISNMTGDNDYPQIVSDGAEGAIITWSYDDGITDKHIYAQKINSAGIKQWGGNGTVICNATGDQEYQNIASDGAGGAIITWDDKRTGTDIYAQKIDSAGTVQWTANGTVICNASNDQSKPQIACDGAEGAIITWHDYRKSNSDIYAQKINSAGIKQWGSNGTVICNATGNQDYQKIVSDGMGGAIITWEDKRIGMDIYAQKIDSAGATQWDNNGTVICNDIDVQFKPQIASDGAGGAIITYGWNTATNGYNIAAQKINPVGITQWTTNGTIICNAISDQFGHQIACDGAEGAIITWHDYRGPNPDIYAQRIAESPSGNGGGGGNPIPGFDLVIIGVISSISVISVVKMLYRKKKLMLR